MSAPSISRHQDGLAIGEVAALARAEVRRDADPRRRVTGIAALDRAGPGDLVFFDNARYAEQASSTAAAVCLTSDRLARHLPEHVSLLIVRRPYHAFVAVARALYPHALQPSSLFESAGTAAGAFVHPSARMEAGVTIDPGATIGPRAEIGAGTAICAGAAIGPDVRIGRNCSIGANVSIVQALIGDRVVIHPGCAIGQDGFGFVMGSRGHMKIPQVGRVIIQDDVEIGAGTTVDRGAIHDTVVGEGTKIDNLVQIGHNVSIGRHCVLVAQVGIAGSATLEDYVVLAAKVGVKDHVTIGEGSQIAATSNVGGNVPPGSRWGGTPAKPVKQWFRELSILDHMAREAEERSGGHDRS
jgi:UDP-3-O-[3-hydroxymyristoyl] glucosamine N-acyltransferase